MANFHPCLIRRNWYYLLCSRTICTTRLDDGEFDLVFLRRNWYYYCAHIDFISVLSILIVLCLYLLLLQPITIKHGHETNRVGIPGTCNMMLPHNIGEVFASARDAPFLIVTYEYDHKYASKLDDAWEKWTGWRAISWIATENNCISKANINPGVVIDGLSMIVFAWHNTLAGSL